MLKIIIHHCDRFHWVKKTIALFYCLARNQYQRRPIFGSIAVEEAQEKGDWVYFTGHLNEGGSASSPCAGGVRIPPSEHFYHEGVGALRGALTPPAL